LAFEELVKLERVNSDWKRLIGGVFLCWKSFSLRPDYETFSPSAPICSCDYGDHRVLHFLGCPLSNEARKNVFGTLQTKCPNIRSLSLTSSVLGIPKESFFPNLEHFQVEIDSEEGLRGALKLVNGIKLLCLDVSTRDNIGVEEIFLLGEAIADCLITLLKQSTSLKAINIDMVDIKSAYPRLACRHEEFLRTLRDLKLEHLEIFNCYDIKSGLVQVVPSDICDLFSELRTMNLPCEEGNKVDIYNGKGSLQHLSLIKLEEDNLRSVEKVLYQTNYGLKSFQYIGDGCPFWIGELLLKYAPNIEILRITTNEEDVDKMKKLFLSFHKLHKLRDLFIKARGSDSAIAAFFENCSKLRGLKYYNLAAPSEPTEIQINLVDVLVAFANKHPKRRLFVHFPFSFDLKLIPSNVVIRTKFV